MQLAHLPQAWCSCHLASHLLLQRNRQMKQSLMDIHLAVDIFEIRKLHDAPFCFKFWPLGGVTRSAVIHMADLQLGKYLHVFQKWNMLSEIERVKHTRTEIKHTSQCIYTMHPKYASNVCNSPDTSKGAKSWGRKRSPL